MADAGAAAMAVEVAGGGKVEPAAAAVGALRCPLPAARCQLLAVRCALSTVHCPLSTVHCTLHRDRSARISIQAHMKLLNRGAGRWLLPVRWVFLLYAHHNMRQQKLPVAVRALKEGRATTHTRRSARATSSCSRLTVRS